jgi:hypothetical protein
MELTWNLVKKTIEEYLDNPQVQGITVVQFDKYLSI